MGGWYKQVMTTLMHILRQVGSYSCAPTVAYPIVMCPGSNIIHGPKQEVLLESFPSSSAISMPYVPQIRAVS
jgi:hypothetical protein